MTTTTQKPALSALAKRLGHVSVKPPRGFVSTRDVRQNVDEGYDGALTLIPVIENIEAAAAERIEALERRVAELERRFA